MKQQIVTMVILLVAIAGMLLLRLYHVVVHPEWTEAQVFREGIWFYLFMGAVALLSAFSLDREE